MIPAYSVIIFSPEFDILIDQGGNITIEASCADCDNTTEVMVHSLTYGDGKYAKVTCYIRSSKVYDRLDMQ